VPLSSPKPAVRPRFVGALLLPVLAFQGARSVLAQQPIVIDASAPALAPQPVQAALGTSTRADGQTLTVNSQYLVLNGKPWLPVMGEFHYSRVPREDWEAEILKMKAGGVQIISTYIIWIHQEEIEGQFDWSGRRDLRAFVALCAKHGMYVYPRIGPWAHGEARNGGLPDWVLAKGPTRRNDPVYLAEVTKLYNQIGEQLKGQLWKDNGPVIGIQLENEYRGDGTPGTGDDHIRTLKEIARTAGLDAPLYTVTGWDGAAIPLDAVLPVFGGYPDAPWDGSPNKLPPNEVYAFRATNRIGGNMGIIGGAGQHAVSAYAGTPFLTAEVGGGLEDTYFRRPVVSADDIAAVPTVLIGSGANMLGFYMFQGGRNPEGKLTTLQESQRTAYPTDVPVKSYDFQAPLGEFGDERPSFRRLKLTNYFLNDFGDLLAPMAAAFPATLPTSPGDLAVPRVSARTSGQHGFVFLNNYIRGESTPTRSRFAVDVKLPDGHVQVPAIPLDVPSGAYGIWPINFDLGAGLTLRYSTAQLFHQFTLGQDRYLCLFAIPGVPPELAVETTAKPANLSPHVMVHVDHGVTYLRPTNLAEPQQIVFRTGDSNLHLLLMSRDQAETLWRVPGRSDPLFTAAQFYSDGQTATLESDGKPEITLSLLASTAKPITSAPLTVSTSSPLLRTYTAHLAPLHPRFGLVPVAAASPRDPLGNGPSFSWRKQPIPMAPEDDEFGHAASWTLTLPNLHAPQVSDVRLVIRYNGDVARLRSASKLVDDNFWNGTPWELSLRDLHDDGATGKLTLQVLPWPDHPPMYLEAPRPAAGLPTTPDISVIPQYQLKVSLAP